MESQQSEQDAQETSIILLPLEHFAWTWLILAGVGRVRIGSIPKELMPLLGPVAALHVFGSSQELKEELDQVHKTALFNEQLVWVDELRLSSNTGIDKGQAKIKEGLNLLSYRANLLHSKLKRAEEILQGEGWQFDVKKRRVKAIPYANRPEEFVNRAIRLLYEHWIASGKTDPPEIRGTIQRQLSLFFPTEMLGSHSGGPIDVAIWNSPK